MKMSTRWANFSTPLMVSIDKMYVCGSVWVQHPCKMHAHVTEWAPPHHVSESLTCKNMIVCVCVRVNVSGTRLEAGGQPGWLADEDGWMWTSLSRSFHSGWADSSVWDAFVISLVWRAPRPLPLMDHSEPPHPPTYECICVRRTVIAGIAPPAGHVGARKPARSINVHLSTRVDILRSFLQLCSSLKSNKWCFSKTSAWKQVWKYGLTLLLPTTNGSSRQAGTF